MVNTYGLTEATAVTTVCDLTSDTDRCDVLIGWPIANTQTYILDSELQPVPIGVIGDLYIGGAGLARGYHNRAELTAGKFIPHPFSVEPGARLYRTGDLARYRPNGAIEYLGRLDQQVKVRGFRIELGEVEAALNQHPQLQAAVVIDYEDEPGLKRLVAYIVPAEQATPTASELLNFLKINLPAYMLPSTFVTLAALPLTPHGKIDRRGLPTPEKSRPDLQVTFAAPRTPIEEAMVNIWLEVLRIGQVGIHDNFFELGGHSLLATQVVSRIRDMFQAELPLRSLFDSSTVAGMAEQVETALRQKTALEIPPLRRFTRNGRLPLAFSQERMWFIHQLQADSSAYNVISALRLKGPLNRAALEQSVNEIVRRHEILRTNFVVMDGQPVQVITPPPISAHRRNRFAPDL
ncbi:MAG: AMP-binding protein [Anaerolineales bacterium]|nr:AMP-binding protein [Anaerolineales bacterium]